MSTDDHSSALTSTDGLAERIDRPTLRSVEIEGEDDARQHSCVLGSVAEGGEWR